MNYSGVTYLNKSTGFNMEELNKDAVSLAAGIFFGGNSAELSFGMQKSKPSDRCQNGLDNLLECGYVTSEKMGRKGVSYHPTDKMQAAKWPRPVDDGMMITQPL